MQEIIDWLGQQNALKLSEQIIDPPDDIELDEVEYLHVDAGYIDRPFGSLRNTDLSRERIDSCKSAVGKQIAVVKKLDILAWYQPIHYYGEHWGIYLFDSGIDEFMTSISSYMKKIDGPEEWLIICQIQAIAMEILRLHEQYHHMVEAFAIKQHMLTMNPTYDSYNKNVYAPGKTLSSHPCDEERLCDAFVYRKLQSKLRGKVSKELYAAAMSSVKAHMASAVGPYMNSLDLISDSEFKTAQRVNLSQVLTATTTPTIDTARSEFFGEYTKPFATLKEQVFIVRDSKSKTFVPGAHYFAAPRRKVEKLIMKLGYEPTKEGDGSHTKYKKEGAPFIVLTKSREQSQTVLKSTAKALGMDLQDFLQEVRNI